MTAVVIRRVDPVNLASTATPSTIPIGVPTDKITAYTQPFLNCISWVTNLDLETLISVNNFYRYLEKSPFAMPPQPSRRPTQVISQDELTASLVSY